MELLGQAGQGLVGRHLASEHAPEELAFGELLGFHTFHYSAQLKGEPDSLPSPQAERERVRSLREEVAGLRPEGFLVRDEEALRQQSLEEF
jgi:hypothetical protein